MACAGGTWLNSPLLPGLTPNALSRPKDGGLVAVLFLVLRSSVIFTVINGVFSLLLGFAKGDVFYGLYHGTSPLNHHVGEYVLLVPSILYKKMNG